MHDSDMVHLRKTPSPRIWHPTMISERNATEQTALTTRGSTGGKLSWDTIQCPGLTPGAAEIHRLSEDIPKRLAVFSYKEALPYLWVVFAGGTGTGKSTLFNAFCEKPLSQTGVERPKTFGPILYVHRDCPIEKGFPFPSLQVNRQASTDSVSSPATGTAGHLFILEHNRDDWSHLLIVDTPDLDSVEAENRQIAEDLYLLSDAVVFVTSQEKYADDVPYQFFVRMMEEKKPYFFLLNKTDERLTEQDVMGALRGQGISFGNDRVWLIPYAPSDPFQWISEHLAFHDFVHRFSQEFSTQGMEDLREKEHARRANDLTIRLGRVLDLLERENQAGRKWLSQLDVLCQKTCHDLINEQKKRFTAQSREYLQREIRRLFTKYDVLAKPRRIIREVFLTAFALFGFRKESTQQTHKDSLSKIRQKIDLAPVQLTIEKFNRSVLEKLPPSDETSPLFKIIRQTSMVLNDEEIKERIWKEHDHLDAWLEQTFQKLSQELPIHKKWGIYSTSILWGILIISFEIVVGGGFSMLDAALDSVIAPFVTKGAVELFAYHEIQKIARELAKRYQEGLLSVVQQQRKRYEDCLQSLLTPPETVESLQALHSEIASRKVL